MESPLLTWLALHEWKGSGKCQCIGIVLYEAFFAMLESLVPEYDACGHIREPSGSVLPGITPSDAYPCEDDSYVIIAGNGDSILSA